MINRINYKYQLEYLNFLEKVKSCSRGTVKRAKNQINHLLIWLDETPLDQCHQKKDSYPQFLKSNRLNSHSPTASEEIKTLHPVTQKKNIQTIRRFLKYLKLEHPKNFSKLPLLWIESLTPASNYKTIQEHIYVSEKEILTIAEFKAPDDNLLLLREQASACMLFASGMRSTAFGSLPIKAVDLQKLEILQDPSIGVRTKNGRAASTTLLNIPEVLIPIKRWDQILRSQLDQDAMWYAPFYTDHFGAKTTLTNHPAGENRNQAVAKGLRKLFSAVRIDYKSPHKFRHGHAIYALKRAKDMADYKAISQNLMHGNMKVTDEEYGWLNQDDVKNRILNLSINNDNMDEMDNDLKSYLRNLSKGDLRQTIHIATDLLAGS